MTAQMEANPTMFLDPDQSDTADNRLKTTFMGQGIYLMTSIFGVHVGPNGLIYQNDRQYTVGLIPRSRVLSVGFLGLNKLFHSLDTSK